VEIERWVTLSLLCLRSGQAILAHYLLQTRTAVLNDELHCHFERWHPGLKIKKKAESLESTMKMAA